MVVKRRSSSRLSEYQYQDIAASIPGMVFQALVSADGSLSFKFVSEGFHGITGWNRDELESGRLSLPDMICPEDLPLIKKTIAYSVRELATGAVECRILTPQGDIKWIRATANPRRLADGSALLNGVALDITDQRKAEVTAREHTLRLEALHRMSQGLAGSLELIPLAELVLDEALTAAGLDAGIMRYVGIEPRELEILASRGLPAGLERELRDAADRLGPSQSLAARAAETGEPIVVRDLKGDDRCRVSALAQHGFRSAVYLPFKAKGRTVGVLSGYTRRTYSFNQADMEMLGSLGTMVGMANAHLYEQIQRAKNEWESTFDAMSEGVALISAERRIIRANWTLARLLGTKPRDLVGRACHEVVHGLAQAPLDCPVSTCLSSRRTCEIIRQEQHLGNRWLKIRVDPVFGQRGEMLHMVQTFEDITVEKKRQFALERLHNLSLALSGSLDVSRVVGLATEQVKDTFGGSGSTVGIALLDDWGQSLNLVSVRGPGQENLQGVSLPVGGLLPEGIRTVFQEHRTWIQSDMSQSSQMLRELPGFLKCQSFVAAPLVAGDRALGVLFFLGAEPWLPADDELALINTYAREIALAVQNAQLFRRTDQALARRIAEQEALTGVLGAATRSLDLDTLLEDLLKQAARALDVDMAGIALTDDNPPVLVTRGAGDGEGDSLQAVDLGRDLEGLSWFQSIPKISQPIMVPDVDQLPEDTERTVLQRLGANSTLIVPVTLADRPMGTLHFLTRTSSKHYTAGEVSMAQAIANHLASVVENARLHKRTAWERSTLESIITSMTEGLVVMGAKRDVLFCNQAAETLLNVRGDDFVGRSVDLFQGALGRQANNAETFHSGWEEAMSNLDRMPKLDLEFSACPGKRSVEVTLFPVGSKEEPLGIGILLRDVTREREVDRMKTEFISIASHELRTPMTSVFGYAELLLMRSSSLPPRERGYLEVIHKESGRLSSIIEDLLDVSRIETGRLSLNIEAGPIRTIMAKVLENLQRINPRHTLALDIPEDLPHVLADREKLEQVFLNLVDNAVKYSPEGGPVLVTAQPDLRCTELVISISDKGLGIPEDEKPRLFTRFHRIQRAKHTTIRGTGLGLYIVKSLLEMMGGRIWVQSKLNEGSTFSFSLPLALTSSGTPQD